MSETPREPGWDGVLYHRISTPQATWGARMLERITWRGDETVLDVGCGSGRLTAQLLERLPRGRVVALDIDASMVSAARASLMPAAPGRVVVVRADASALPVDAIADTLFSAATLHWVADARQLYQGLLHALKAGGRLEAQCGGGPNVGRLRARATVLMQSPDYAAEFASWRDLWRFDDPETAAADLHAVGFVDVETWLEETPTPLAGADAFREFIGSMIFRAHLAHIRDATRRDRFLDVLVEQAASDDPPFVLDYWRLNLRGRRPSSLVSTEDGERISA